MMGSGLWVGFEVWVWLQDTFTFLPSSQPNNCVLGACEYCVTCTCKLPQQV